MDCRNHEPLCSLKKMSHRGNSRGFSVFSLPLCRAESFHLCNAIQRNSFHLKDTRGLVYTGEYRRDHDLGI